MSKEKIYPVTSLSNTKLGELIPSLNLPAGVTCNQNAPCFLERKCYAMKGNFAFTAVKECHLKNLEKWKSDPFGFFDVINNFLQNTRYKYFRFHSSGDIPDSNYLDSMCKLARKNKDVNFLCFTKKYKIVNEYLTKHRRPGNLCLVFSYWQNFKDEDGNPHNLPTSYVKFSDETKIPKNAFKCSGYCGECINTEHNCWKLKKGQSVYFKKHQKGWRV